MDYDERERSFLGMINKRTLRPDSKVPELCHLLRQLALENGPGAKLPKASILCDLFSTSIATLNEALYVLENQHVIVRRQGSGIFVSPRIHRKSICVLLYSRLFLSKGVSPFWGMFWARLVREMERRMHTGNEYYSLHFVMNPSEDELAADEVALPEDVVSMVLGGKVHAVLAVGMEQNAYRWLQTHHIPSVTYAGLGSSIIDVDHEEATRLAISSLVEQGCQRLGLWTVKSHWHNLEQNPHYSSFRSVLAENQLPFFPELVQEGIVQTDLTLDQLPGTYQEQGFFVAEQTFGNTTAFKPDGVFITDDMMTHGALAALRTLHVNIGSDLKVATHANAGSPILFGESHRLNLIQYDTEEIIQAMFQLIEKALIEPEISGSILSVSPHLRRAQPE